LKGVHASEIDNRAVDTDHLLTFFSPRCYKGFDGLEGFFTVYSKVFSDIDDKERIPTARAPLFGKSDSP